MEKCWWEKISSAGGQNISERHSLNRTDGKNYWAQEPSYQKAKVNKIKKKTKTKAQIKQMYGEQKLESTGLQVFWLLYLSWLWHQHTDHNQKWFCCTGLQKTAEYMEISSSNKDQTQDLQVQHLPSSSQHFRNLVESIFRCFEWCYLRWIFKIQWEQCVSYEKVSRHTDINSIVEEVKQMWEMVGPCPADEQDQPSTDCT